MCEIELLKCSERIINKYRDYVNGNKNTSIINIQKKLTRDFILGTEMFRESEKYVQRYLGSLIILVDIESMTVINLINKNQPYGKVYVNTREKRDLNKLLKLWEGKK